MTELKQKRYFNHRRIKLMENGVDFFFKDINEENQYFIPFEDMILNRISKRRERNLFFFVISLLAFGLGFILTISLLSNKTEPMIYILPGACFVISAILMTYFLVFSSKRLIYIPLANNQRINIFQANPNEQEIDLFFTEMRSNYNTYLKRKYANINIKLDPEPQLHQILWLRNRDVISLEEYEKLRDRLLLNQVEERNIGFAGKLPE